MAAGVLRSYALRLASILILEGMRARLRPGAIGLELGDQPLDEQGRRQVLRELDAVSLELFSQGRGYPTAPASERCTACGGTLGDRQEHARRLREGLATAAEFDAARQGSTVSADAYGAARYYAEQTLGWLEGRCDPCTLARIGAGARAA